MDLSPLSGRLKIIDGISRPFHGLKVVIGATVPTDKSVGYFHSSACAD